MPQDSRSTVVALACAAALSLALASCGGDKPAFCDDRAAFQDSIEELKQVDVRGNGLGELQTRIDGVRTAADKLVESAKSEFGPQAEALKAAISTLGTAVEGAASSPSAATVAAVSAGISAVQRAFADLSDSLESKC